jgi:hypothetical protein
MLSALNAQGFPIQDFALDSLTGKIRCRLRTPRTQYPLKRTIVVPLMGPQFPQIYEAGRHGKLVLFCWDVWEPLWHAWVKHLIATKPKLVIVTARQSAIFLSEKVPDVHIKYVPEAINTNDYKSGRPLHERTLDVLELGRRHTGWHDAVTNVLAANEYKHFFEFAPKEVIFPTSRSFVDGLADTKVSVCFPSSLTHPKRSGCVETTTQRYLESMASGCLVLGHAPAELCDMFGFNPVVEVDWVSPSKQLIDILNNVERYEGFAQKATIRAREVGSWELRSKMVAAMLREKV